jgi:hypothetical protein
MGAVFHSMDNGLAFQISSKIVAQRKRALLAEYPVGVS